MISHISFCSRVDLLERPRLDLDQSAPSERIGDFYEKETAAVKSHVKQLLERIEDLVVSMCPVEKSQRVRMRQTIWNEIIHILDGGCSSDTMSQDATAFAKLLDEGVLVPSAGAQVFRPKVADLWNAIRRLQDLFGGSGAYYELVWKGHKIDGGTDDESEEKMELLKDKIVLWAIFRSGEEATTAVDL